MNDTILLNILRSGERSGTFCSFEHPLGHSLFFVTPDGALAVMKRFDVAKRVNQEERRVMLSQNGAQCAWQWMCAIRSGACANSIPAFTNLTDLSQQTASYLSTAAEPPSQTVQFVANKDYRPHDVLTLSPVRPSRKRTANTRLEKATPTRKHCISCIVCQQPEDRGDAWIQCDDCGNWTHTICDPSITNLFVFHDSNPDCRRFLCIQCREAEDKELSEPVFVFDTNIENHADEGDDTVVLLQPAKNMPFVFH